MVLFRSLIRNMLYIHFVLSHDYRNKHEPTDVSDARSVWDGTDDRKKSDVISGLPTSAYIITPRLFN